MRSRRVGVATFFRLMAEHGSAEAALDALPGVAAAAGVPDYAPCPVGVAVAELRAGRIAGARLIAFGERTYPAALLDLNDPPPLLWAMGDLSLLARPAVALVGARNASSLGTRMARKLADDLGRAGLVVVSGLARGVDTAAHLAALPHGTIAVMAGGVDVVYPAENAVLAQDIAERGLRLSEQPMGLTPQGAHFPRRNRIISGLARGVVVVEAAARSGSLITARDALDQGREVMAVPGHPFDARASGCNMLLRDGATLVRDAGDVMAVLGPLPQDIALPPAAKGPVLSAPPQPAPAPVAAGPVPPSAGGRAVTAVGSTRPHRAVASDPAGRDAVRAAPRRTQAPTTSQLAAQAHPKTDRRRGGDCAADRALGLHQLILDRLGPSPLAEDQLIRDLALSAGEVAPQLVTLELDGRISRHPGGLIARV